MKYCLGIDPGKKGSVAVVDENLNVGRIRVCPVVGFGKSKKEYNIPAMVEIVKEIDDEFGPELTVCIEKVTAMPGQGTVSMLSFGMGYGLWLGILNAFKIPYTIVHPRTWKSKVLSDMKKDKQASVIRCKQLFPKAHLFPTSRSKKESSDLAEALLIAYYGLKYT